MVNPGAENKGCLTSGNEKGGGGENIMSFIYMKNYCKEKEKCFLFHCKTAKGREKSVRYQ